MLPGLVWLLLTQVLCVNHRTKFSPCQKFLTSKISLCRVTMRLKMMRGRCWVAQM